MTSATDFVSPSAREDEYRQRVIQMTEGRGGFVPEIDGFVYYYPNSSHGGVVNSSELRIIADELDRRNAAVAQQVAEEIGRFCDALDCDCGNSAKEDCDLDPDGFSDEDPEVYDGWGPDYHSSGEEM